MTINPLVRQSAVTLCCVAFALCTMGLTCEDKPDSPVIARVGSAQLTIADIDNSIPPEYSGRLSREQHVNFVKQWINNELLYQEALRLKINKEKEIRDRIEKMNRDLLSAEVLSRQAPTSQDITITDDMLMGFYQEHQSEFIRTQPVFKYQQIVVAEYTTAWKIRNQITPDNFLDLASKYSQTPVASADATPFIPDNLVPAELRQVLPTLRVGGTTAPIKVSAGFSVVRLLDKQEKGSLASLDEVREEILDRLSTEIQKQKIDEMLANLRMKTEVTLDLNLLPGGQSEDTSALPQSK